MHFRHLSKCYEFFRVSQCVSVKDMWDVLEVTHE